MSEHLNLITLVGRLGAEPETRYFESGSVLSKISLAVDRQKGKDEAPNWFSLECWGKLAEVAANYTNKGSLIAVQGELKFDEWTDGKTRLPRSKPVIRVNNLELLSSGKIQDTSTSTNNTDF
ncbi:MAG: single-stranded DNA-binding protein [Microcystaceae cyanobacterium]